MTIFTSHRKNRGAVITGTLTFAVLLTLAGCANPVDSALEKVTSGAVNEFIEEQTGGSVQTSMDQLPDGFPSNVPVPDVDPTFAMRQESEGVTTWIAHFGEGVDESTYEALKVSLEGAGFVEVEDSSYETTAGRLAGYSNDSYDVHLSYVVVDTPTIQLVVMDR